MSPTQGRGIVRPIARHGDDLSSLLEQTHKALLVHRASSGEDLQSGHTLQ